MSIAAVSIENSENIRIGKIQTDGSHTILEAKNTNKLSVQEVVGKNCSTLINLEECWDSDIKNINIKRNPRKFIYTTLSSAIMASKNIK